MAAIDFPASPTDGQQFSAPNGITYVFSATPAPGYWKAGGGVSIAVGVTPPASPYPNQLWWNSELGLLFIWYNDGNSTQWVPIMPGASAPQGWRLINRQVPVAGQQFVDFTSIPSDINDIEARFEVQPAVASGLVLQFFDGSGTIINGSGQYAFSAERNNHTQGTGTNPVVDSSNALTVSNSICLLGAIAATVMAGIRASGKVSVNNIRDTTGEKMAVFHSQALESTNNYHSSIVGGGVRYGAVGAITGLRFGWGGGQNFQAGGYISLWGSP